MLDAKDLISSRNHSSIVHSEIHFISVSVPANSGYGRLPDVSINDGPEEHGATVSSPQAHQRNIWLVDLTHFTLSVNAQLRY